MTIFERGGSRTSRGSETMPPGKSPDLRNPIRKRGVVRAVVITIVLLAIFGVYRSFNPPWRVRIHITNIPTGTYFVSMVSDSDGKLRNMEWSPNSELSIPFTMHPANCIWSFQQDTKHPKVDWDAFVRWELGERYGVLTRDTTGVWRVGWFKAESTSISWYKWFLGRGETAFDVSKGTMIPLPDEQVIALGLDRIDGYR